MNDGQIDVQRTEKRKGGEGMSNVCVLCLIFWCLSTAYVPEVYSPIYVIEDYSSAMSSKSDPAAV